VCRLRPDVIYLASQGFGRGGPLGEVPAFGPLNSAFAGITYLWNHADAPYPGGSSLNHPDHVAARLAAAAVLAALEHRRRTGEGQLIEMSQSEAAAYLAGEFYLEGVLTGRPATARGNAASHACPHGVYPTAGDDRWIAIAVAGDEAWARFRSCLGWEDAADLDTLSARLARAAELDARVAEWTGLRSGAEAAATLQAAGISAMPVVHGGDLRADPHLAARGALVTVEDRSVGPVLHIGHAIRLERTPLVPGCPAPALGEHTADVLSEALGLSAGDVERLVAEGVCR
jgi:benzylsuccinate CoA-transferase BbsF subunit